MNSFVIIDDEQQARNLLSNILKRKYGETVKIYCASLLKGGVELIRHNKPNIVYLDIKMPEESGLKIMDYFSEDELDFEIIFTTAYNEYAIEAFKISAIDYLLKPIDLDEFYNATEKALKRRHEISVEQRLNNLEKSLLDLSINKIALEVPRGFLFVDYQDILFFQADGMYTKVYLTNEKTEIISKPLKHFTEQLKDNTLFYKPHRSYLVNLKYIKEVKRSDGMYVVMQNGKVVNISREKKNEFIQMIKKIFS